VGATLECRQHRETRLGDAQTGTPEGVAGSIVGGRRHDLQ
jgi:hypothetical protein